MLLLTYNARLKSENRARARKWGLQDTLEVHSFHSFAVKYYDNPASSLSSSRDEGLNDVIQKNAPPRRNLDYSIVIVDEAQVFSFRSATPCLDDSSQDMTPLLHALTVKILVDIFKASASSVSLKTPQLFVIGDEMQCIFQFKDADPLYLTRAFDVFPFSNLRKWVSFLSVKKFIFHFSPSVCSISPSPIG